MFLPECSASDIQAGAMTLGLAFAIDQILGELPTPVHPVAWMGKVIRRAKGRCTVEGRVKPFLQGVLLATVIPVGFTIGAVLVSQGVGDSIWGVSVGAVALSSTFALRALGKAGEGVQRPLEQGDIDGARFGLRSLCSRDSSQLSESELVGGTVESLAENLSDSFVAPILFYCFFGLPGAVFYRTVNTLDAVIGYRGRYEYLGKCSARLDDLLNLVPARLTAVVLLLAGRVCGADFGGGLRALKRDRNRTESPNAGWPMSVMAGLLGVQLVKPGAYCLGDAHRELNAQIIAESWRIVRCAAYIFVLGALVFLGAWRGVANA